MDSFLDDKVRLYRGDCLDVLRTLDENSIDGCVTDPPYHLTSIVKRFSNENAAPCKSGKTGAYKRASAGFMGKQWDGGDIAFQVATWRAIYRVLKPGAHLVAFGGTRTYHRMASAIEDAGFEIRDQIGWLYGSGFPKSHDVSKGIDRLNGSEPKDCGPTQWESRRGTRRTSKYGFKGRSRITEAESSDARDWQGWGTALKPAWESLVLARKPLSEKSVAANVLKHGTGAINVDGCRVAHNEPIKTMAPQKWEGREDRIIRQAIRDKETTELKPEGRWPANIIHDGSEEVLEAFPESGPSLGVKPGSYSQGMEKGNVNDGWRRPAHANYGPKIGGHADSGSVARFFYTAKADAEDRVGSKHPTVKPVDLIQYLVRLIIPKGGTVLDPFAGTGTTGEAAFREGCKAILIEREAEYQADIERRMALVLAGPDEKRREIIKQRGEVQDAGPLFGGAA